MNKLLIIIPILFVLYSCVPVIGTATVGVIKTGVQISEAPRTFGTIVDDNIIDNNIMTNIKIPKISKKLPHLLTKKEIDNLFDIDLKDNKILMEVCILELFYSTGMRISELTRIKICNINFEDCTIKVLGKGNKERYVFLCTSS